MHHLMRKYLASCQKTTIKLLKNETLLLDLLNIKLYLMRELRNLKGMSLLRLQFHF